MVAVAPKNPLSWNLKARGSCMMGLVRGTKSSTPLVHGRCRWETQLFSGRRYQVRFHSRASSLHLKRNSRWLYDWFRARNSQCIKKDTKNNFIDAVVGTQKLRIIVAWWLLLEESTLSKKQPKNKSDISWTLLLLPKRRSRTLYGRCRFGELVHSLHLQTLEKASSPPRSVPRARCI